MVSSGGEQGKMGTSGEKVMGRCGGGRGGSENGRLVLEFFSLSQTLSRHMSLNVLTSPSIGDAYVIHSTHRGERMKAAVPPRAGRLALGPRSFASYACTGDRRMAKHKAPEVPASSAASMKAKGSRMKFQAPYCSRRATGSRRFKYGSLSDEYWLRIR